MIRIFISLYILLFFACSNNQTSSEKSHTLHKDTVEYTYSNYKKISDYLIISEDIVDTTYYEITYPIFKDSQLNEKVQKLVLYDGESTVSESAQSFLDGFNEFASDLNIEYNLLTAWTKDINSRVISSSPLLITLYTDSYEYSGGAHGHRHTFYANFDTRNNKLLEWKDILKENKLVDLTAIAEKKFRILNNLSSNAPLDKDYFFNSGVFELNNNFGLTKKSLVIYYNEYEIKPYSEGPTVIEIPYEEIKELLNTQGKDYIQSINKT